MAGISRQRYIESVVPRLLIMPLWSNIPSAQLEAVAGWWWDSCQKALTQGHFAELEQFIRRLSERLAHRGMSLEDFAQLLRVHRDAALSLGWTEEQIASVDETIDTTLQALHIPGWVVTKGYSYCGTVKLELPQEPAAGEKKERRNKSRAKLKQKIRVRSAGAGPTFDEIRDTLNVSVNGLYFESFRDYTPGMRLFVAYPYDSRPGAMNRDYLAEVVRVNPRAGSMKRGVAVRLLHSV